MIDIRALGVRAAGITPLQLDYVARLAILAAGRDERHVVALHAYQGLDIQQTAGRLNLTTARVKELYREVCDREAAASEVIARALAPKPSENQEKPK